MVKEDTYNATQVCARPMMLSGKTHYNAMICIMDYCVTTPERGSVLKPYGDRDGISTDYKIKVMVRTNSDYAKYLDTRRSMTERVVYLNGVQVTFRSSTQKMVRLLTVKAELNVAVMGVQDALFIKHILKSLELKVKLPILERIDNGGGIRYWQ